MKKNGLLIAALLLFATPAAFSQTSKIAHRSHSGKNKTFNTLGEDHLGLPPERLRKQIKSPDTTEVNHNPPKQDSTQNKPKKGKSKSSRPKATPLPPKKAPAKTQEKSAKPL